MVRIKICGVTRGEDAELLAELGVDAIGLNFYPKSPRFVTLEQARSLLPHCGPFMSTVGVFVSNDPLVDHAEALSLGLRAWQTYSEKPVHIDGISSAHIPAYRVKTAEDLERVRRDLAVVRPAAVLIDSYVPGELGGTGHVAPWHLLAEFDPGAPLILAGGLTPDNVAEAIRIVRPWGVDVASGVESAPGIKEEGRVRAFVEAVRATRL